MGPAPRMAAMTTSRIKPVRRETSVSPPTVAMRAVSPGVFAQPGATVEDMYRPYLRARTGFNTVEVIGPTR